MPVLTVPVKLNDYWFEEITREEALRRLDSRNLSPEERAQIEPDIPERSRHYLTFEGPQFREYLDWGDGVSNLLLILPMKREGNTCSVEGFIDNETFIGLARTVFTMDIQKNQLFEDGGLVPFTHSTEEVEITLDVSFVIPGPEPEPERNRCCRACEWVHSRLNIHWADPICCLFCCYRSHWL